MAAHEYQRTRTAEALFCKAVADDLTTARAALEAAGIAYVPALVTPRPDGGYSKRPRLDTWKQYLTAPPTLGELQSWLDAGLFTKPDGRGGYAGIGALLTTYSRVIAVDLDTVPLIEAFTAQFDLPTYTEMTVRGGLHLLYRLPPDAAYPRTLKRNGRGELLAGRFMVIAPTPGYAVKAGHIGAIRTLSTSEYAALKAYFAPTLAETDEHDVTPASGQQTTPDAILRAFYRRARDTGSRNTALFETLTNVRDTGINPDAARAILKQAFIDAPGQRQELAVDRAAEFERTLQSVYSRAPRLRNAGKGLPNVVRESLLKQEGGATVARFSDAALYAEAAGIELSVKEFMAKLAAITNSGKAVFSRDAVENSLKAVRGIVLRLNVTLSMHIDDSQSQVLQTPAKPPSSTAPTDITVPSEDASPYSSVIESVSGEQPPAAPNGALMQRPEAGQNPQKPNGRPSRKHRVPTASEWAVHLGVSDANQYSDPLAPDDFRSVKAYKQAVHTALIRRAPGQYSRRLLAARVNVNPVTLWRWNKQLGITPKAQYMRAPLTPALLDYLEPAGSAIKWGSWLELPDGTRIPPHRERAASLLAAGIPAEFVQQVTSYYELGKEG